MKGRAFGAANAAAGSPVRAFSHGLARLGLGLELAPRQGGAARTARLMEEALLS